MCHDPVARLAGGTRSSKKAASPSRNSVGTASVPRRILGRMWMMGNSFSDFSTALSNGLRRRGNWALPQAHLELGEDAPAPGDIDPTRPERHFWHASVAANVPPDVAQKVLGYASLATTRFSRRRRRGACGASWRVFHADAGAHGVAHCAANSHRGISHPGHTARDRVTADDDRQRRGVGEHRPDPDVVDSERLVRALCAARE